MQGTCGSVRLAFRKGTTGRNSEFSLTTMVDEMLQMQAPEQEGHDTRPQRRGEENLIVRTSDIC